MLSSRSLVPFRELSSGVGRVGGSRMLVRGRFQNWKPPIYSAPHVFPLEMGPDFSYADGRPIYVTSRIQLEYKQDQLRLAKKIVKLLSEVNEMEAAHKQAESQRIVQAQELDALRPKSKGTRSIV